MNNLLKRALEIYLLTQPSTDPDIIIIVETSDSIDDVLMSLLVREIQEIASTFGIPILVLYVDYQYRACQFIELGEQVELCPAGGGGTDFRAGFRYIEAYDFRPDVVIYLTDGRSPYFPEALECKVIWAQFGKAHFDPPFGDKVQMSNN